MRLGLTESTYQYLFSSPQGMFGDRTTGYFDMRGMPAPYFLSTATRIDPSLALEWIINRTAQLGLQVAHCSIRRWDDSSYLDRIHALLDENELELMPSIGADLITTGNQTQAAVDGATHALSDYAAFGGVRIAKFCVSPMIYNRFSREPSLEDQLARIVEHVRPIVRTAEDVGITLAFENHLDYRISEVIRIIEAIDSPNLKILFDTGNTVTVIEDPVEAAKLAAPYTVLAHLKDVRILPWTPGALYASAVFAAPLGRGNVDNYQICQIFQEHAPDPKDLCLSLENMPVPPNEDEDLWAVEGIRWAKEHLAEFLG